MSSGNTVTMITLPGTSDGSAQDLVLNTHSAPASPPCRHPAAALIMLLVSRLTTHRSPSNCIPILQDTAAPLSLKRKQP